MQQFMHDDVFLKLSMLFQEILAKGYDPFGRARSPLVHHPLHPNLGRFDVERIRPAANGLLEGVFGRESAFLLGHGIE